MRPTRPMPTWAVDAVVALGVLVTMAAFAYARVRFLGTLDDLANVGSRQIGDPPPAGINPRAEFGYDGQYFLRLALEPLPSGADRYGIVLDEPAYRAQRVGYPALAWLLSQATPARAALSLLLVNLAAVVAVALLGLRIARRLGRSPLLAVALAVNPVTVQAVARDTSEAVALAFLAAAVLLLLHERPMPAGVALLAAALTRETTLLLVLGAAAALAVHVVVRRTGPDAGSLLLVAVPSFGWSLWQYYEYTVWGTLPVAAGDTRIGTPLAGVRLAVADALTTGVAFDDAAWLLLPLAAVLLLALVVLRSSSAPLSLKVAYVASLALLACLTRAVWVVPAGWMRAGLEAMLLALVLLAASRSRWQVDIAAGVLCLAGLATMPAFLLLQQGT